MRWIPLKMLVPVLFCLLIQGSVCAPNDYDDENFYERNDEAAERVTEHSHKTRLGESEGILKNLDTKITEISKRSLETEGLMRSFLERVQILQDFSVRLEKTVLQMESSIEIIKAQGTQTSCVGPVVPETTELAEVIKINSKDPGHMDAGTRGSSTNTPNPAKKLILDDEIKELVSSPKATIFSQENFLGESEDYDFESAEFEHGCYNLGKLNGKVGSMDTKGKCVRLFDDADCKGLFMDIYPGSGRALSSRFPLLRSIGPCLTEGIEGSFFQHQTERSISKKRSESDENSQEQAHNFDWKFMSFQHKKPLSAARIGK